MKSSQLAATQSVAIACATAAMLAVTSYSLYKNLSSHSERNNNEKDGNDGKNNKHNKHTDENISESTDQKRSVPGAIKLDPQIANLSSLRRIQTPNTITIAYASTTGTCESFAKSLLHSLRDIIEPSSSNIKIQICTVDELDWWDELLNNENDDTDNVTTASGAGTSAEAASILLPPVVIFVLPTWTNGTLPEQYASLLTSLDEISHDWRVAPRPLRQEDTVKQKLDKKTIQIASFGMGSTAYDKSTFCKPAKDVFKIFMKLGARSLLVSHGRGVVGTGDDDAGDCKKVFQEWKKRVVDRVQETFRQNLNIVKEKDLIAQQQQQQSKSRSGTGYCSEKDTNEKTSCGCQEEKNQLEDGGCCKSNNDNEDFADNEEDYSEDDYSDDESDYGEEKEEPDVMDLEDIGNAMQTTKTNNSSKKVVKEMVTPKQAVALKKEGYKIIGTHSAVKLCRWTKHQLRGRGGCYKHTFYGITSYQCMEATPSLACANKCM